MKKSGISVVGAYATAEEALADALWDECRFLLADIDLPKMSGIELIAEVKKQYPSIISMVYTIYEDRETVFAAIKAGAHGYLLKGSSYEELLAGLRILKEGGSPMNPAIARKLIDEFHVAETTSAELSIREIELLKLVARGMTYNEVAGELGISPNTVHTHIKNIYEKLQARNRQDALRKARNLGVI